MSDYEIDCKYEKSLQSPIAPISGDDRLTTLPIGRPQLWDLYKKSMKCFWTAEEVNISVDKSDYKRKLTEKERHFVNFVLAFFAASDKIVNLNLAKRFKDEIKILEAEYFYDFQMAMENIHAEMYSLLLDTIITDEKEKAFLQDAIKNIPVIAKMTDWMFKWINSDKSFAHRLLGMACVEGIFFSGCFCAIYWLANRGLMPGLAHSNELIARDEGLHTFFATVLYNLIREELKLSQTEAYEIIAEAVEIAKEFINAALPIDLPEMNARLMSQYIETVADNLLVLIELPKVYNSKQPFKFMEQINMIGKTNFFERYVSDYQKAPVADNDEFEVSTNF